jgi:hypothetical protein
MSQELLAGAEALLEDVYGYTAGAVTLGSNFLAGAIHGISGIPLSPFPGMERPFAVGQALGSSLGLAADAATLGASIAGLGGSGAAAVTSLGTLAPVAVPIAELSLAAATASAAAAGGHLEALQSSGRMYMSADGPHKKGPTRAQAAQGGSKNPATFDEAYAKAHAKAAETPHIYSQETLDALGHVNPAHERYLVGLRRHMEAPPVQDESLRAILRLLYKPNATVGNRSTGAAWRVEQTTRTQVGGHWHGEALVSRCNQLAKWLAKNPHAADSDIQTAKNILSAHIEAFISP